MPKSKRIWALLVLAVVLGVVVVRAPFVWQVLAGHQVGIVIFDPRSEESHFIPSGDFREVVVHVDLGTSTFRTLGRVGQSFESRTLNFSGVALSTSRLPLLFEGYCGDNSYGFSADGTQVVYFRQRDKALCVYDGAKEKVLIPAVASTFLSIPLVRWVAENEVVLILKADDPVGRKRDAIIRFNIQTKDTRTLYEPTDIGRFDHAISPDGQLLVFADSRQRLDIYEDLKVIDLRTGQLICHFENEKEELLGSPTWNCDGTRILFSMGSEITTMDLKGKLGEALVTIPPSHICYQILWIDDNTAVYEEGTPDTKTLNRLEVQTGRHVQLRDIGVNGSMYRINEGKMLCEVGY